MKNKFWRAYSSCNVLVIKSQDINEQPIIRAMTENDHGMVSYTVSYDDTESGWQKRDDDFEDSNFCKELRGIVIELVSSLTKKA